MKKLIKKVKNIIFKKKIKKDQNVKSDALLEEEKNELIIERFVENHRLDFIISSII